MTRILIIEDEVIIRKELRRLLVRRGYEVEEAGSIREALEDHPPQRFDLVLADLRLPGALGTDIIGPSQSVPVVIMTSYASVKSAVEAMKLGARDYITKPFSTQELLARIRAVLRRRAPEQASDVVRIGALQLDGSTHRVTFRHTPLQLGPTEFKLLNYLMHHAERVHTRSQLLDRVWGDHKFIEERTVDVHVKRLRKSLGDAGIMLETVRGVGYRFTASIT